MGRCNKHKNSFENSIDFSFVIFPLPFVIDNGLDMNNVTYDAEKVTEPKEKVTENQRMILNNLL